MNILWEKQSEKINCPTGTSMNFIVIHFMLQHIQSYENAFKRGVVGDL